MGTQVRRLLLGREKLLYRRAGTVACFEIISCVKATGRCRQPRSRLGLRQFAFFALQFVPKRDDAAVRTGSGTFSPGRLGKNAPSIFHMERIQDVDAPNGKRALAVAKHRAGQDSFDAKQLKVLKLFDEISGLAWPEYGRHRIFRLMTAWREVSFGFFTTDNHLNLWISILIWLRYDGWSACGPLPL